MKSNLFALITTSLLFSASLLSQEKATPVSQAVTEKGESDSWRTYGDNITLKEGTSLAELLDNKDEVMNKGILLEGTISEICQNKGCWMVVGDGEKTVRVEFKDYGFFVPWAAEGKEVRLQGTLGEKTISQKAAEHMAGEMKNPPVASDKVKEKQTITVFVASGVMIKGGTDIGEEQRDIIEGKKEHEGHQHEDHDH